MTRMGIVTVVFSAGLVAGSVSAQGLGSATADVAPVCRAWEAVPTPNGGKSSELRAVDSLDASNAWAVGRSWTASSRTGAPAAMRWDGSAWTDEPLLDLAHLGVQPMLEAVAIAPAGDPWVVGHLRDGQRGRNVPLILRWSGGFWSEHRITLLNSIAARFPLLRDVAVIAENDAWVVGEVQTEIAGVLEPFAARWDGTAWTEVAVPGTADGNRVLTAVSAAAADAVWAVGYDVEATNQTHARIYRWDGREWSVVDHPAARSGSVLRDIVVLAPDDIWTVGEIGTDDGIFLHSDGSTWTSYPGAAGADARSIDGAASNDVWASGARGFYHWDGTSWSLLPSAGADNATRRVVAVAGPCDAWSISSWGEAADSTSLVERLGPSIIAAPQPAGTFAVSVTGQPFAPTIPGTSPTVDEVPSSPLPEPVTGSETEAEPYAVDSSREVPPPPQRPVPLTAPGTRNPVRFAPPLPPIQLPPAPVSLTVTAMGARRIALKWVPGKPHEADQTYFVIERCVGEVRACQPFTVVEKVGGRLTSFIDSRLTPATSYTYRVYAVDDHGGRSEPTAPEMARTSPAPPRLTSEAGPR